MSKCRCSPDTGTVLPESWHRYEPRATAENARGSELARHEERPRCIQCGRTADAHERKFAGSTGEAPQPDTAEVDASLRELDRAYGPASQQAVDAEAGRMFPEEAPERQNPEEYPWRGAVTEVELTAVLFAAIQGLAEPCSVESRARTRRSLSRLRERLVAVGLKR